ncbi:MAG: ornithine cyclodeaminase family protein [Solobacterium sp.]|nr:ornithine cyclodeaminase family protein [Solobacterium sp.]
MKVIDFNTIQRMHIPMSDVNKWVAQAIASKDETTLPPKISMHQEGDIFCNIMPCIVPNTSIGTVQGAKIVTRYPKNIPSLNSMLLLMDATNGNPLALMDATWITAMRTGAVAAHSISLLAKKDFSKLSFLGLGNTARATLESLLNLYPERQFKIKLLKYKDQAELFIDRFKEYPNLSFSIIEDTEQLIRGADVIVSCVTVFNEDIAKDEWFDEGVLVVPVHTKGFSNCDLFFDKVYADDTGHVKHFKNFAHFKQFAEVSDVVNQRNPGREDAKERIIAYNIGLSIHDLTIAAEIYHLLDNDTSLNEIDLVQPTDKFWL